MITKLHASNKSSHKGFSLIGILIGLSVISVLMSIALPKLVESRKRSEAQVYAEIVTSLVQKLQMYHLNKVSKEQVDPFSRSSWPATLNNLMTDYPDAYWPMCSNTLERSGKCRMPSSQPFSRNQIGYSVLNKSPVTIVKLTFDLRSLDGNGYSIWAPPLLKLPHAKITNNKQISVYVGSSTSAAVFDEFLKKDGSTPLTDHWDIGGKHAIVNAKDITIKNSDNSQRSLGTGVVRILTAEHNDIVQKHSCPLGSRESIHTSIKGIYPTSYSNKFSTVSSSRAYATNYTSYWKIGLDYYAKDRSDRWRLFHDGDVTVQLSCIRF